MTDATDAVKILCAIHELLEKQTVGFGPVDSALFVVAKEGNQQPQELTGSNPYRVAIWICNNSDKDLYIAPVPDIGVDRWSMPIAPKDTLLISFNNYPQMLKGSIYGFWETGAIDSSKAMITEYSIQG